MPSITAEPRQMGNELVTYFTDAVSVSEQIFNYPQPQTWIEFQNTGTRRLIITLAGQEITLAPGDFYEYTNDNGLSSFSIRAQFGHQSFAVESKRPTPQTMKEQIDSLGAQLAQKANKLAPGYSDFSDKVSGSIVNALDSGQTAINYGVSPMSIDNGLLVHSPYTSGIGSAGYLQIALPSKLTRMGGEFVIPVGAGGAQFVLVGAGEDWSLQNGFKNAGIHAWSTKNGWVYGLRQNGTDITLARGNYKTPLVDDGITKHKFEISVDHKNSTATLYLPDGSIAIITDSRISNLMSEYVVWELYEHNPNYATSTLIPFKIASIWASHENADSSYNQNTPTKAELAKESSKILKTLPPLVTPQVMVYQPATQADWTAPTSLANVDATNAKISVMPPSSGKMLIEIQGHVVNSNSSAVYLWALDSGGNGSGGNAQRVVNGVANGNFTAKWLLTGMTTNGTSLIDIKLSHFATAAGPILRAGNAGGYFFVMKATPIM